VVDANPLDDLIQVITSKVRPESWDRLSGEGSMVPYRTTLSLVVRQRQDIHEGIVELLTKLRRDRDIAAEAAVARAIGSAPPKVVSRKSNGLWSPQSTGETRTDESGIVAQPAIGDEVARDPVEQFEERIKKLESELAGLRSALRTLKPAAPPTENKSP
jgi:hypothetical protein